MGKKEFIDRVKRMSDHELVATYQYVSGLFARQEEAMTDEIKETARDLNELKFEIMYRLSFRPKHHPKV